MKHSTEFHRQFGRSRAGARPTGFVPRPATRAPGGWLAAAAAVVLLAIGATGAGCYAPELIRDARIDRAASPSAWAETGPAPALAGGVAYPPRAFGLCHSGGGENCVVDGDTFWVDGAKIRIADIDAPETHPPRCPHEAALGERATTRLRDLLSAGPLALGIEGRATDRYGRALRVVTRGGWSLGGVLVEEGLARPWEGRRRGWCADA